MAGGAIIFPFCIPRYGRAELEIKRSSHAFLDLLKKILGKGSQILGEFGPIKRRDLVAQGSAVLPQPSCSLWKGDGCRTTFSLGG